MTDKQTIYKSLDPKQGRRTEYIYPEALVSFPDKGVWFCEAQDKLRNDTDYIKVSESNERGDMVIMEENGLLTWGIKDSTRHICRG